MHIHVDVSFHNDEHTEYPTVEMIQRFQRQTLACDTPETPIPMTGAEAAALAAATVTALHQTSAELAEEPHREPRRGTLHAPTGILIARHGMRAINRARMLDPGSINADMLNIHEDLVTMGNVCQNAVPRTASARRTIGEELNIRVPLNQLTLRAGAAENLVESTLDYLTHDLRMLHEALQELYLTAYVEKTPIREMAQLDLPAVMVLLMTHLAEDVNADLIRTHTFLPDVTATDLDAELTRITKNP